MDFARFSDLIIKSISHSDNLLLFELDCHQVIISVNQTAEKKIHKSTNLVGLNFASLLTDSARQTFANSSSQAFASLPLTLKLDGSESVKCKAFVNRIETGWFVIVEPQIFFVSDALNEISQLNNQLININRELQKKNRELKEAGERIKKLRRMLPICSYCKKIRDDKGYWDEVESYISEHSDTTFSHGICPTCLKTNFPDLADDIMEPSDEPATK